MDELDHIKEFRQQGFFCSQILMLLGLETMGKTNPDLVRASHGLAGGLGFSGELCGALSGGACLLGLYAGKGTPEQAEDPHLLFMIKDLVTWFNQEYGSTYGGIRCEDILAASGGQPTNCPLIVSGVFQKVKALLVENGFDLTGQD